MEIATDTHITQLIYEIGGCLNIVLNIAIKFY
jgi:hypothetical protein